MIFEAFENTKTGRISLVGFENERDCTNNIPAYIETDYQLHPGELSHDLADAASEAFEPVGPMPAAGEAFLNTEIGRKYFSLFAESPGRANEYLIGVYNEIAEDLKCIAYETPYVFGKDGLLHGGISIGLKVRSDEAADELGYGFFALDAENCFDIAYEERPCAYMFIPAQEPVVAYYDKLGKEVDRPDASGGGFLLSGLAVPMAGDFKYEHSLGNGLFEDKPLPVPVYDVSFSNNDVWFPEMISNRKDYQSLVNESRVMRYKDTGLHYDFLSRKILEPAERSDDKEIGVERPLIRYPGGKFKDAFDADLERG